MAKKKRQGDPACAGGTTATGHSNSISGLLIGGTQLGPPAGNSDESTDSTEDVRIFASKCTHINKAVDLSSVKRAVAAKANRLSTECELCKRAEEEQPDSTTLELGETDNSLWMCLRCGHQACGRYKNKHALHHYNTPHSDSHSLCVNTSRWNVWCYDCDDEVQVGRIKKLSECIEYIKKFAGGGRKHVADVVALPNVKEMGTVVEGKGMQVLAMKGRSEFQARGLTNLRNTCFFNSVMQCLGQTPYLLKLLEETAVQGQQFRLPGGKLMLEEKQQRAVELEPLEGILEEWKPLTRVLAETLRELQSGRSDVYNPRPLFTTLVQRMTQFAGGDQHDSHELLRHLLDAVREEDLRRYQSVILRQLGLNSKTDPATVEGDKKKIVRFYGAQASELLLPTEQVFRGVLTSTLQCQDCGHRSQREDYFLDLSLPIAEKLDASQQQSAAAADGSGGTTKKSKTAMNKERRQARKATRRANAASGGGSAGASNAVGGETQTRKSDSESDADVEDNIEDSNNSQTAEEGSTNKGTESGYNSDKNSPDNAFPEMVVEDAKANVVAVPDSTTAVGMLSADTPATSPASSETNIDLGSPMADQQSQRPPFKQVDEEMERPQSRLAFAPNANNSSSDLKVDLEKLSLDRDAAGGSSGELNGMEEEEDDEEAHIVDDMDVDEDDDDDGDDGCRGTISTPVLEEGVCSVESCLNQFTASELLTADNKVSCAVCSKRHGGADKKAVYTSATKRLLIYNPPAVLILHLKRFQVPHFVMHSWRRTQFRPSKILDYVKFPTVLDIAPFCSKRALALPTFAPDQKQVLYSLYGVVEHSGSIHCGHYVAYIKVRPKLANDHQRWHFLPKNHRIALAQCVDEAHLTAGKWFHVSDSHAAEVNESEVLNAKAYLLFYERIL